MAIGASRIEYLARRFVNKPPGSKQQPRIRASAASRQESYPRSRARRDCRCCPLRFAPEDLAVAGLSSAEILQAITSRAAQACGLGHRKGPIAAGFDADILAIDGDPLQYLAAVRRPRAVFVGGHAVLPPGSPASREAK